jgi:DMSO/TMAO reductase YedYZ molybdopterin-dependent catalytic subunit
MSRRTGDNALSRRAFLGATAALPTADLLLQEQSASANSKDGENGSPLKTGLVLRQRQPENLEFPFHSLDSFITSNERFYVRNHYPVPSIDLKTWKLKVEGSVDKPLEFSLDSISKLESRTMTVTLECAGNSRGFLVPKENGVLWELGAVSNAKWKGVSLADILDRAGSSKNAVDVVLVGADAGPVADPKSPGPINFARSVPIEKVKKNEVLLAYEMNGDPLSVAHGFPLRAIVAGWYGMASIKWLSRIVVLDKPFDGFFQSIEYSYFERKNGLPSLVPITQMQVKAAIARPTLYEVIPAGTKYRMHGAAWAGEASIAKVEVSTDGGKTWNGANILGEPIPFSWQLWEYTWDVPMTKGRTICMARATDSKGRIQPMERDLDRRNYMISHVLPIEVTIHAASSKNR